MLDVEFEWFDPQPEVDFHGLKMLCRQLFDIDAQLFELSELVDLILSQPLLGSTVKVDGNETDPYAFLTVLNLHVHRVCTETTYESRTILTYTGRRNQSSERSQTTSHDTHLACFPSYLHFSLQILPHKLVLS
jgi:hypothetical protein